MIHINGIMRGSEIGIRIILLLYSIRFSQMYTEYTGLYIEGQSVDSIGTSDFGHIIAML